MKYTIYRIRDKHYIDYKPILRNGKPVQFRTQAEGEKWLEANPPKSSAQHKPTFEVRRTIKQVR